MAEMLASFKPPPFKVKSEGDPELLLQKFKEYIETFTFYLDATGQDGEHTEGHVQQGGAVCKGCKKAKSTLMLVGGREMIDLFKHTGKVEDLDTYSQAVTKVEEGIKKQTNQASAKFKLFQQMPQGDQPYSKWYPQVKEQASRCDWTGYNTEKAARDAILFQTNNKKLMKKIIAEDIDFNETVKVGLAMEQGAKKVDEIRSTGRKEVEKVANLNVTNGRDTSFADLCDMVRSLKSDQKKKGKVKASSENCKNCNFKHRAGQSCPAKDKTCNQCEKKGHFANSSECHMKKKHKKETLRAVKESESSQSETDSVESVGRVKEEAEGVRAVKSEKSEVSRVRLTVLDKGKASEKEDVELLIDSGVNKTLLSEKDWQKFKAKPGERKLKLKRCFTKFSPFGTKVTLPMMGRSVCRMEARGGAKVTTMVYVVKGESQSLLGLKDGKALGIIDIKPEGRVEVDTEDVKEDTEEVNHVTPTKKENKVEEGLVSDGQTQNEIDSDMKYIASKYPAVFNGLGRAKVEPIHIEIDPSVRPVQQKQRRIALKYKERFRKHLEELKAEGVIEGPLKSKFATGWISNPVITSKSYTDKKIRVNLDTRPMADAVKTTKFPIPTPSELRHDFFGSDRFSSLDMNHAFHQFELSPASKDLYTFWTDEGLYRYNTLVMGASSGSSECQERLRLILVGLKGVAQIKDDIVVHGKGREHDERLEAVFKRLMEYNITLRLEKCHLGKQEVKWFGNIYSKQGMSPDPEKVEAIKAWPRPLDKAEVKSFLQTAQFGQVFMRPGDGLTYSDLTKPLRMMTAKSVRYKWTAECEESFRKLKDLLVSDTVMAPFDPERETRLYCDDGPTGVAATVAQCYQPEEVPGQVDHPVWRPVHYNSRAKIASELNYGKVDGESLAILSGILSNRTYLYGDKFTVITDHQPLVPLYKSHSRDLPVRVAKHKSKLLGFNFDVVYEAGTRNPADYGSRHHPSARQYSPQDLADVQLLWVNG